MNLLTVSESDVDVVAIHYGLIITHLKYCLIWHCFQCMFVLCCRKHWFKSYGQFRYRI